MKIAKLMSHSIYVYVSKDEIKKEEQLHLNVDAVQSCLLMRQSLGKNA